MLELGVGAEIFRSIGILLWIVLIIGMCAAIALPKSIEGKAISTFIVLAIFFGPMLPGIYERMKYKQRYNTAKALFDERCKTAGEKIYRTVEGVESIELIDTRGSHSNSNYADPNWKYAGFPGESVGSQYIAEFLYYHKPRDGLYMRGLGAKPVGLRGYRKVIVAVEGGINQYKLLEPEKYLNDPDPLKAYAIKQSYEGGAVRYAVKYEDISKPEDRKHWIAGGRVTIVDRQDNSNLGEFIRYAFEPGLGNTGGGKSPWAFAIQCPKTNYGLKDGHIRSFVEQVIIPVQGN